MLKPLLPVTLLLSTLFCTNAFAEVITISKNNIDGDNPSLEDPYTSGIINASSISASGIGRGEGISARTASDRYNASSWSTGELDSDDYFTFALDADDGYQVSLTSFTYTGQVSSTGPTDFALRSSLDSFSSDIGTPTGTGTTIDLSASEYQNLTDPIEFRLYAYSAESGAGTFSVNDYEFDGEITATPEPQTLALIGVGASVLLWNQRRPSHAQANGRLTSEPV